MILTGRPVGAEEAMVMGLANRIAPAGAALPVAQKLAAEISAFPQACMKADRLSAMAQWDLPLADALAANEKAIISEFAAARGKPVDLGGYYHQSDEKAAAAMRPSATRKSCSGMFAYPWKTFYWAKAAASKSPRVVWAPAAFTTVCA